MNLKEKLKILSDSAKYDASCSSSGVRKKNNGIGNTSISGICHSYSNDGRCISLLKILLTNCCIYDCKYCINRKSNNILRAFFSSEEICEITINFYKRNYIEGLFLSSGIIKNPDYTMSLIIETIHLLRNKYHFTGYIHAKTIPGASFYLIKKLGLLVDRLSTNIELPLDESLKLLAPNKNSDKINETISFITNNKNKEFSPGGQSTQMIVGASKETDLDIIKKSYDLYKKYKLKRIFYSAYVPINNDSLLPNIKVPPLKREHRIYQADWLIRFYNYKVDDILSNDNPYFNLLVDPKIDYALRHSEEFPKEINLASYYELLKVPGIGPKSAKKIISSRKYFTIEFKDLKNMGISLKNSKYFITCNGKYFSKMYSNKNNIKNSLMFNIQLSLFDE